MTYRRIAFLCGILACASLGLAQQQPAQPSADSGSVIRTETRVVLVDAVATDKKGGYVRDLTAKDFKVWEDNKEQKVTSFYFGADPSAPSHAEKRYLVLFFDNSTMATTDQIYARQAAVKFIDANAGANRLIAVVNFGGALQIAQNFTDDPERLKAVVNGLQFSAVHPNERATSASIGGPASLGGPRMLNAAADFGARDMILALSSLAKSLGPMPGRKTLVLLTAGFPLTPGNSDIVLPEITAAIDACNRSNIAIYPIDVRGLFTGDGGAASPHARLNFPGGGGNGLSAFLRPAAFTPGSVAFFAPQAGRGSPGGGGGGTPGAGGGGGGGGTRGTAPTGTGGPTRTGGTGNPGGGAPTNGGRSPFSNNPLNNPLNNPNNPNNPRNLLPKMPEMSSKNQDVMFLLANGTGGFVIHDTNDLLGGLQKIGQEQNEFYILGYTPEESVDGSCHTLKVKVDRGGVNVRARSGYCNVKQKDLLAGNPLEKQLETRVAASEPGNVTASMQLSFFYKSANVARVNMAMDIDPSSIQFEKQKGGMHATVNLLGIAYAKDGSVGARFSDAVKLDVKDKKEVELLKAKPLHYENQFDVAAGQYNLKVVCSAGGEHFGKLDMPLVVESYDTNQFSISSLALSKNIRSAGDAGSTLDAELIDDKKPLIAQGMQIIPSGTTHFKTSDQTVMYFEVYEPLLLPADQSKPPVVAIQLRILDGKTGEMKVDSGAVRIEVPQKGGNPVIPVGVKLPIAGLASGSYRVQVSAVDSANKSTVRRADFEIQ